MRIHNSLTLTNGFGYIDVYGVLPGGSGEKRSPLSYSTATTATRPAALSPSSTRVLIDDNADDDIVVVVVVVFVGQCCSCCCSCLLRMRVLDE